MADAVARIARDADLQAASRRVAAGLTDGRFASAPWQVIAVAADGRPLAAAAGSADRLLVASAAGATNLATPVLLRSIANGIATVPDLQQAEVMPIADAVLKQWSRLPAPVVSPRIETVDRDDRRWWWLAALCLLALEHWVRRARPVTASRERRKRTHVSPDTTRIVPDAERTVTGAIADATRRARILGMVEAFGWGAVAAAISPLAGATVAVAVAAWRWSTTSRSSTVVRLERAYPEARNLFVTADELARNVLQAKPHARARVFADAARDVERVDLGAVFPIARLGWIALFAALSWGGVEIRICGATGRRAAVRTSCREAPRRPLHLAAHDCWSLPRSSRPRIPA